MSCIINESEHNKFVSSLYWMVFRLSEDECQIFDLPSNLTKPCEASSNSVFIIKPDIIEFLCTGYPYYYLCIILQTKLDPLTCFSAKKDLKNDECFKLIYNYINNFKLDSIVNQVCQIPINRYTLREPFNYKSHIKLLDAMMIAFSYYFVNLSQILIEAKKLSENLSFNYVDNSYDLENAFALWFHSLQYNMGFDTSSQNSSGSPKLLDFLSNSIILPLIVIKYYPELANKANLTEKDVFSFVNMSSQLDKHKRNETRKIFINKVRKILGETKTLITILCLSIGDLMFPVESFKPNFIVVLSELFHNITKNNDNGSESIVSRVALEQISDDIDVLMTSDDVSIEEMIKNMQNNDAVDLHDEIHSYAPTFGCNQYNDSCLIPDKDGLELGNISIHPNKTSYAQERLQSIYSKIASIKQKNSFICIPKTSTVTHFNSSERNEIVNNHKSKTIAQLSPVFSEKTFEHNFTLSPCQSDNNSSSSPSRYSIQNELFKPDIDFIGIRSSSSSYSSASPNNLGNTFQMQNKILPISYVNNSSLHVDITHNATIQDFEMNLNKSCDVPSIYRHEDSLTTDDETDPYNGPVENQFVTDKHNESLWFDQSKITEFENSMKLVIPNSPNKTTRNLTDLKSHNSIIDYFDSTDDEHVSSIPQFFDEHIDSLPKVGMINDQEDDRVSSSSDCSVVQPISLIDIDHSKTPTTQLSGNQIASPKITTLNHGSCKLDMFSMSDIGNEDIERKKQLMLARLNNRNKENEQRPKKSILQSDNPTKLNTTVQKRIEKNKKPIEQCCQNDKLTVKRNALEKPRQDNHVLNIDVPHSTTLALAMPKNSYLNNSRVPKLYAPMKMNSNRSLIHNAITNYCLAGDANKKHREKAIEQLSHCNGVHFLVNLKPTFQYRGLYVYCHEQAVATRIHGVGPRHLEKDDVEVVYRYHSDKKCFTIIPLSKTISISCDGFTIATIKKTVPLLQELPQSSSPNRI